MGKVIDFPAIAVPALAKQRISNIAAYSVSWYCVLSTSGESVPGEHSKGRGHVSILGR